jgi:glycosyltransferase involved in cell wall biosynthesis
MSAVDINGRFLTQATTGVQRYAIEMVRSLEQRLQADADLRNRYRFRLVTPSNTTGNIPGLQHITQVARGRLRGQPWEQLELPRHTRDHLVLSLCNTAPVASHNVVTVHDAGVFAIPEAYSLAFRLWYQALLPRLGRGAVQILTVSNFSRDELSRRAGIPPSKIQVVHPGGEHIREIPADPGVFARLPVSPGAYLLAVGSRSAHKNHAAVFRAASLLGRMAPPVVIVGGSNSKIFSDQRGMKATNVYPAGYTTDAELRALYENAICLVYPSLYEGFGLPPLEALVCGCPVIVSRTASLPEVCGDAALYCDPQDPQDIARRIEAIQTPRLRDDLRLAGAERARCFTWHRASGALIGTLDQVQRQ